MKGLIEEIGRGGPGGGSGHDPVTLGTANGLSLNGQELSLGLAGALAPGALSAADWLAFAAKEDALSFGAPLLRTGDAIAFSPQGANKLLAGPELGADAAPTFRLLVDADIPTGIARDSEVASAISAHEGLSDPHPVYLTAAEGAAAFDVLGAASAAVAAHEAATDPHPQYLTAAEGAASFDALGAAAAAISAHEAASDPHAGYRLESADHSHQSTGLQAGQLDHGLALTGLGDDDHTQYHTDARALMWLGTRSTSDLPEGTHLYYTEARVSANTDVAANTAARHNALTLGTANGLSLAAGQVLSLGLATASVPGALSAADWTTFNAKVGTARLISTTSPLAGGGDLSADRTLTIADAAADGATKGAAAFAAADFNAAAGVISLDYANGQKASASVAGFLSAADWSTFNAKVAATRAISTTAPLTGGGDLSADRTIAVSDFVASGATHARGTVPDPGAGAGTTKFLREDATFAVPPGTTTVKAVLGGSEGGVSLSASRFIGFFQVSTNQTTESNVQWPVPFAGTIKNFYLLTNATQGGTASVLTVRKNGVNTTLTITITANAGAQTWSDVTNSFTVVARDLLSIGNSAAAVSPGICGFSVELDAS